MRVLFCIKSMTNPGGGAERVLATVANGFVERGHDVVVLTFDRPGTQPFYALGPGVRRVSLGVGSTSSNATFIETLKRVFVLRRRVTAEAPDVVIGFMHSMYIPLGFALLGIRIPLVASEHTVGAHYVSRPLQAVLLRLTPSLVSRVTCVSEAAKETFPRSVREKMVAIRNPISVDAVASVDVAVDGRGRKTLLAVGRLDPEKDPMTLVRAFALLADDFPDWDLRIVGEGGMRPKLEGLIVASGMEGRVSLPGITRNVAAEYTAAQIFVTASRYESFGLTTAEALAHGLPAVGFADCPGTNDLIRPGENGALAEGEDDRPSALAAALRPLMLEPELRLRLSQSAPSVPLEYRPEVVINSWEALIRTVAMSR